MGLTGEKGIGRLASARLGKELLLISRAKGTQNEVRLLVDWSQFDQPDLYLDEVELLLESGSPEEIRPGGSVKALWDDSESPADEELAHGTVLRVEGMMSDWDRERIESIRTRLRRLVSPFDSKEAAHGTSFTIKLDVPKPNADLTGDITPPAILKHHKYRIYGKVEADGSHDLIFEQRGLPPELIRPQNFRVRGNRRPTVGPFQIDLRVWDREDDDFRELARLQGRDADGQVPRSTINDIRRDLNEISGVSIYRDSFRVLPYGEPTNDWLRLDRRRVQNPSVRISNNQIVGYLAIGADENERLADQSNREGLQKSQAFDDLRELTIAILTQLETRRRLHRKQPTQQDGTASPTFTPTLPGLFANLNVDRIASHVSKKYATDSKLVALVSERNESLKQHVSKIQEVLARYRRLSTLGFIVDTVLHDVRTPLGLVRGRGFVGQRDINEILANADENCQKFLSKLRKYFREIESNAETLRSVFQKIEPFGGRKRGRPGKSTLEQTIKEMFELRAHELEELCVRVNLPTGSTTVTIDTSELAQVITNLLDNSLYWLSQVPENMRAITVAVRRLDEGVEILFSDSGPGVDPLVRSRIFEPYISLKPDGIGLGLTIIGEIITEFYDGKLQLVKQGPLDGATFRILLRKRV